MSHFDLKSWVDYFRLRLNFLFLFDLKSWVEFQFRLLLNFLGQNDSIFSLGALREKIKSFWPKKLERI